ncbi:hypothetical protein [Kocuria salsicia]|uniref:hypothetical protein n=1 Tax=Kocuria salsicia TaxID=664639 RepID=UPI0011A30F71|nr:hypothetical protein [Kocuria salsicia]
MSRRLPEPRPEQKHFYAGQLTDAQLGRPITLAGNSWPVRGTLTAVSLDERTGLVEISTRRADGRTATTRVPSETGVIVHRREPGDCPSTEPPA